MSCKSADSPESVLSPNEETPVNPGASGNAGTGTNPASTSTGSTTTQNTTCRDVPSATGTGADVVSQCSFCPNCIMKEELMIAAGRNNDNCRNLIKEVNVRLAGFGGVEPTDQFTVETEKAVKQFQRDYMGLTKQDQTGFICKSTLQAIDEYYALHVITAAMFTSISCECTKTSASGWSIGDACEGWGSGYGRPDPDNNNQIKTVPTPQKTDSNEYPGVHRSVLAVLQAFLFYTGTQTGTVATTTFLHPSSKVLDVRKLKYTFRQISSGYRCIRNNRNHFDGTVTTSNSTGIRITNNHMGNALDIQFYDNGTAIAGATNTNATKMNTIRSSIFNTYLGARTGARGRDEDQPFWLETAAQGAKSWVHVDCNGFITDHKADEFYVTSAADIASGSTLVPTLINLATTLSLPIIQCTKAAPQPAATPAVTTAASSATTPATTSATTPAATSATTPAATSQ